MTQAFGVPTSDNPRPYGCSECDTAFRKHGHLAKHLRSKSHITRLESRGLIPSGTYAALEKCGQDLKDKLVTTNYEQSLISMREIAMQLFQHLTLMNEPQPSYSTSEPMTSVIDNHELMTNYPSSSMSAQPQQILSPTYFSTPPLQQVPQAVPPADPRSMPGPGIMLPHQQPISPPQPIFHQQHQQPAPGVYGLDESQNSQMMLSNMMPHHHHHQQQIHSLDYTIRSHHYQH